MNVKCNDNRFEIINAVKEELLNKTNIETSPDEMKVLNDILFRLWQIDVLDKNTLKHIKSMKTYPSYIELAIAYKELCRGFSDNGGCPFGKLYKLSCPFLVQDCARCIEVEYLNHAERFVKANKLEEL